MAHALIILRQTKHMNIQFNILSGSSAQGEKNTKNGFDRSLERLGVNIPAVRKPKKAIKAK